MQKKQSEMQLQGACFRWAWNTHPETRLLLFHVPNGGSRNSPVEGAQLKAVGLIPGIPDMLFVWKGKLFAFEFKAKGGKLSPSQLLIQSTWLDQYVVVWTISSEETFKTILLDILCPQSICKPALAII
jgi:hypothetical protein